MPSIIKEDLDRLFEYGLYLRTRTIWMGGISDYDYGGEETDADPGVYWNTARRLIMALHILDSNAQRGEKPITVIMNSCGGDWSHGMAMYDAIRSSKNYVTIINMSHARSMSSLIFQAADYRITAPNGYYMIHDGYNAIDGQPRTVFAWSDYDKEVILPKMYQIYLDRLHEVDEDNNPKVNISEAAEIINEKLPKGAERVRVSKGVKGIKLSHIEQLCSKDTLFTPEEMIRLNFADRMLERNDLTGAYANPSMHGLPTGLDSLEGDE